MIVAHVFPEMPSSLEILCEDALSLKVMQSLPSIILPTSDGASNLGSMASNLRAMAFN